MKLKGIFSSVVISLFGIVAHGADNMEPVRFSQFKPYAVGISPFAQYNPSKEMEYGVCIGSIISPRFVLTSAHCVVNVKTGEKKEMFLQRDPSNPHNRVLVKNVHLHPNFKIEHGELGAKAYNDIAILELTAPIGASGYPLRSDSEGDLQTLLTSIEVCGPAAWRLVGVEGTTREDYDVVLFRTRGVPLTIKEKLGNLFGKNEQVKAVAVGDPTPGDSGSAVVCQAEGQTPRIVGILTGTFSKNTIGDIKPVGVTILDLSPYLGWIRTIIGQPK